MTSSPTVGANGRPQEAYPLAEMRLTGGIGARKVVQVIDRDGRGASNSSKGKNAQSLEKGRAAAVVQG